MSEHELSQAQLFDVFSNARRRRTVQYLKQQGRQCDLAPLVEQVAAWENDVDPSEVTRTQRRRVYISLYQTHLPMLEEHGIVDWNPDEHVIRLLPGDEVFDPYLDHRLESQRPWHRFYAVVTSLGVIAFALTVFSVGPLTVTAAPLVALVLCVLVLAVSVVQHLSRRPKLDPPLAL
ncbi:hypothetical protein SAMN04487967_3497 [Natronorubrum sediminis]|uniref:DUF7344 domain-containing protein n=1 Tax=Natronorubrum sediminis TaxID=640943 RepID=A0A1H6G5V0_9EURY|nr:hypothetical protein [Natronorubrum sediminis]SEH17962.1 hypothetical protein SAMN04487967_3497 [Natronorubrum sediminis]